MIRVSPLHNVLLLSIILEAKLLEKNGDYL